MLIPSSTASSAENRNLELVSARFQLKGRVMPPDSAVLSATTSYGLVGVPLRVEDESEYWVDRYLRIWVSYMHTGARPRGLPTRASGGITNFTSMDLENVAAYENMDRTIAENINAVIDGLVPAEQCAIYHKYLHAVYRFPRGNMRHVLSSAKENIAAGLKRRHIWMGE